MNVQEVSCCALQCIKHIYEMGNPNAYAQTALKQFDALCQKNHGHGDGYRGEYITATIAVLVKQERDYYEATSTILKNKGWKLLGTFPGAHPENFGEYEMELWGSPSFRLPEVKSNAL